MAYLVMVPNHWGIGKTVSEAKKACREAGGDLRDRDKIGLYRVPDDYWIDEYGIGHSKSGGSASHMSGHNYMTKAPA